ncbi:MAG: RagB/SusD family nutrient uptake outer membrane protein, partial [Sphingobacteriaceae bacterium]
MKKLTYFFIAVALLSSSSCKKFLDLEPEGFVSPENYYQTEEHLELALNSVYSPLYSRNVYAHVYPARMNMMADEGLHARDEPGPRTNSHDTGDPEITTFWRELYYAIDRANSLLANINKPVMDENKRNVIRGEALFLRAYCYFLLVQNFGPIPLLTTPTISPDRSQVPQSSIAEVYAQILADMEAAEPLVLPIQTVGFGGKVNKSAVRGILARVNLYMAGHPLKDESRYVEASKWAKKVMDDPIHQLNPDYADVFIKYSSDKYDVRESIWEAEIFGNNSNSNSRFGNIGSSIGIPGTAAIGVAYSFIRPTAKLYNKYEDGDMRKDWNISTFNYASNGTKAILAVPANNTLKYARYAGKFRREFEEVLPKQSYNTPINFPILRFADVLLMYAEAENERKDIASTVPSPEAVEAVNKVRRRGWSTGVKSITITNAGSGYTSVPTVTFSAGIGGNTAVGTAVRSASNTITAINLTGEQLHGYQYNRGNYLTPPTITISGGGGSGATAIATIYTPQDAEVPTASKATKKAFLEFIKDERMREFTWEALRKP